MNLKSKEIQLVAIGLVGITAYFLFKKQGWLNVSGSKLYTPKCSSLKRQPGCVRDCVSMQTNAGERCGCFKDRSVAGSVTLDWYLDCSTGENIIMSQQTTDTTGVLKGK